MQLAISNPKYYMESKKYDKEKYCTQMIEMNEATDFLDEWAVVAELTTIKIDSHLGEVAQNTSFFPGKRKMYLKRKPWCRRRNSCAGQGRQPCPVGMTLRRAVLGII